MKQNRYIAFGYQVINGKITVNEKEAGAIKYIFSEYIKGASLKVLTEKMNDFGIAYHKATLIWNKGMIKRILENHRYVGEDEYPQIITESIFNDAAITVKSRKKFFDKKETTINFLNIAFCSECGARYKREYRDAKNKVLLCENTECSNGFVIKDEVLESALIEVINDVISYSSIIDKEKDIQKTYKPSIEAMRITKDINRQLEKRDADITEIRENIFKCATEKYDSCETDMTPFITNTLKAEFEKETRFSLINMEIADKTISTIMISKDNMMQVKFKNGAIITKKIAGKD